MKHFNKYAILVALSALSFGAQATPISHSISHSSTGLVDSHSTETFDSWDLDSSSGDSFPGLLFESVRLATGEEVVPVPYVVEYGNGFPNISGHYITNDSELITMFSFSETVSGAAFNFVNIEGSLIFTAFLGGVEVEKFSAVANPAEDGNFYGFEGIEFDSIHIDITGTNAGYMLDNLQVATSPEFDAATSVPEPESYAMFMAGLALMGFIARRRKDGQS